MESNTAKTLKLVNWIVPVALIVITAVLLVPYLMQLGKGPLIQRLTLEPFVMPDGDLLGPKTVDDLKGKVTFISFWATWCGPCRNEMPQIGAIHDHFHGNPDVQVWTILLDQPADARVQQEVQNLFDQKGVTFPVFVLSEPPDPGSLIPRGIPHGILVDEGGQVVQQWTGARAGYDKVVIKAVGKLLDAEEK